MRFRELIEAMPATIRVGKNDVPFSTMEDIFYSVYDYVTYGEMMKPDQFDASFENLDKIVPAELRIVKSDLYRVIRLTEEQNTILKDGGDVAMDYRKFVSFSYSLSAMRIFARKRIRSSLAKWNNHTTAVILGFATPPGKIVVNIPAVYRAFKMVGDESWSQYAKKELEVIVKMDAPLIISRSLVLETISL